MASVAGLTSERAAGNCDGLIPCPVTPTAHPRSQELRASEADRHTDQMHRRLEVCCFAVADARVAIANRADRIELCAGRPEGGTTPSAGMLHHARAVLSAPVFVMIRPRGGDFVYGPDEQAAMRIDAELVARLGFPGIVIGALTPARLIDIDCCAELIEIAKAAVPGISITFHRAFDAAADPISAYEVLRGLGVDRILTSGQRSDAVAGSVLLRELIAMSGQGFGPAILPGGGVRPTNAQTLLDLGATELHSSATARSNGAMDPQLVAQLAAIVHSGLPSVPADG